MGTGSAYTEEQVQDWLAPVLPGDLAGSTVLELGCGNASLLVRVGAWKIKHGSGVDLGSSVRTARLNIEKAGLTDVVTIIQADLTTFRAAVPQDLVYCIGVLQHLKEPHEGWNAVLENTRPGGRFHCWVYAHEGNSLVRFIVEPVRKVACRLPWWFSKYVLAASLVFPYFIYANLVARLLPVRYADRMPLGSYARWISKREFAFFRQVAFDQIVTPQTVYFRREEIKEWLADQRVEPGSHYLIMRNGNSWKFGGKRAS